MARPTDETPRGPHAMTPRWLALLLLALVLTPPLAAAPGSNVVRDRLAGELLDELLPGERPAGGRELFAAVLASEGFVHRPSGPFDVYVRVADGLDSPRQAEKAAERAAEGLAPVAARLSHYFGREQGVVSGRRFPIVLVHSTPGDEDEPAYDRLLALLDHCEDGDFSGFKPDLAVFTDTNRQAFESFTWEVLVANVGHDAIARHDKEWFDHGVGYAAINLLVNRLFAKGGWGPPPPWLINGLVDELDIQAYGDAWVAAGESVFVTTKTAGWFREGWEGFVPQGQQPPPPVKGPPPDLETSTQRTVVSDKWMSRSRSEDRHWSELAKDLRAKVPVSLQYMASGQRFENRDRAYSRCVLHLLLEASPEHSASLLEGLDHESRVGTGGMRTGDPLPEIVARALGGVPDVDALAALTMGEFLESIGRDDLRERVVELGGEKLLAVADHRQQAAKLAYLRLDDRSRQDLYLLIVEIENYQQLQQWEVLGQALDRAAGAALDSSKRFPRKDKDRQKVVDSWREALGAAS